MEFQNAPPPPFILEIYIVKIPKKIRYSIYRYNLPILFSIDPKLIVH